MFRLLVFVTVLALVVSTAVFAGPTENVKVSGICAFNYILRLQFSSPIERDLQGNRKISYPWTLDKAEERNGHGTSKRRAGFLDLFRFKYIHHGHLLKRENLTNIH